MEDTTISCAAPPMHTNSMVGERLRAFTTWRSTPWTDCVAWSSVGVRATVR